MCTCVTKKQCDGDGEVINVVGMIGLLAVLPYCCTVVHTYSISHVNGLT